MSPLGVILIISGAIWGVSEGARILGVFPIPSYSHQIVYQAVYKELAGRGHELVVLTTNPIRDANLTNLKEIDLSFSHLKNILNFWDLANQSPKDSIKEQFKILQQLTEQYLRHPEVQALIKNAKKEHFDLVIVEWVLPTMLIFGEIFKCPTVGILSSGTILTVHEAFGNPVHPVLNPEPFLPFHDDLTFWNRLESVKFSLWLRYHYYYNILQDLDNTIPKIVGRTLPSFHELSRKVDMLFLNVNPIFSKPRPNGPAIIEYSSLHINPSRPLPPTIGAYLDNSTQGAIYFSLGSNLQSTMLPVSVKQNIMQAFSELPYNVLWKFEDENLDGKPQNVEIRKWLPQQDILNHPNIRLFITQGGLQSLEEAIHSKVPVLGLPFFSDQPQNIRKVKKLGIGLGLDYSKMSKDDFKNAIIEVIEKPRYASRMAQVANLLQDQPMKSLDKVVWWMEYVIRHKGTKHLRLPNADIEWWTFLLLDVLAYCLVVTLAVILVSWKLLQFLIRMTMRNDKLKIF